MTNAQTEARAIALAYETAVSQGDAGYPAAAFRAGYRAALAAKDAAYTQQSELAAQYLMRAERAEAQLAEAKKALEPFARFAEIGDVATIKSLGMNPDAYHIGDSDTIATGGRNGHESYRKITWGDLCAARRVREGGKVE